MPSLPLEFLNRARKFAGEEYEAFVKSLSEDSPTAIRKNPFKSAEIFLSAEKIDWSENGRYLDERPSFTLDPLFHAGCYYVQDASSQFLEKVFLQVKKLPGKPLKVLDLCAAPGGKSTHILSMLDSDDLLVSNEVVGSRNNILRQNIIKWGNSNAIVTQNDPSDFSKLSGFFDIILVDAPCSGEGLFRKDPDAIDEWSEANINRCVIRQHEILKHAYDALKPGGFLIYSTCTFEAEENDMQVEKLADTFDMDFLQIDFLPDGVVKSKRGLLFFPHRIRGEGFYISLLKKKDGAERGIKKSKNQIGKSHSKYLDEYLTDPGNFNPLLKDDRLFAIPKNQHDAFSELNNALYVRLAGIYMGELKGDDFIPSEALALSLQLKPDIPKVELTREEAIEYLKGQSPKVDSTKKWMTVCYNNFNLGWIKNLGNRTNNYYPKEWRIKKSIR